MSDIVIVGSGVAGALIAYSMARAGARVTVVEAGPPVAGVGHLVSGPAEQQTQGEGDVGVVLDHQQAAHAVTIRWPKRIPSPTPVMLVEPIAIPPSCVGGRGAPADRHRETRKKHDSVMSIHIRTVIV